MTYLNREQKEDLASLDASPNFVNPIVVECHPRRPFGLRDIAGLDALEEAGFSDVFPKSNRICAPSTLHPQPKEAKELPDHRTGWRMSYVLLPECYQNEGTEEEQSRR